MTEREIFIAALEKQTEAERQMFLKEVCDQPMLQRILRLLKERSELGGFLNRGPLELECSMLDDCPPTIQVGCDVLPTHDDFVDTALDHPADEEFPGNTRPLASFLDPPGRVGSQGRLGHYEVLDVVGKGAFGTVLRAFDTKLERVVAVKVLDEAMASLSPARKRFLREARSSAKVRHENVVSIYSVEEQPIPFLVMEYIPGKTLQQELDDRGPLELLRVLRLGKLIADGLAAAHEQGLIHRDVKPGNIMLEGGLEERIKITDFGLARTADDASLTQSGVIAGTPLYMSPEQAGGQTVDQRTDLFSLGSVLYQMLSGRPPFRAPTTLAVLRRVADDAPRPIQEIIPEVPTWICELIGHLHAKNPDERYGSAREVSEILAKCTADILSGRIPVIPYPLRKKDSAQSPQNTPTSPASPNNKRQSRSAWLLRNSVFLLTIATLAVISEATGVTSLSKTVVRLAVGKGTLVVETNEKDVRIKVDGEDVTIGGSGIAELTLRPGRHTIDAVKDGRQLRQQIALITRNGREVVRLSFEGQQTISSPVNSVKPRELREELTAQPGNIVSFNSGKDQFAIEFVTIGSPGNVPDLTGSPSPAGAVSYIYEMSRFEISREFIVRYNMQYGADHPLRITLHDATYEGGNGADQPATGISWNEAARFVNWLNIIQGYNPAYKFMSDGVNDNIALWTEADTGYNRQNAFRNSSAAYFIPTRDEWYKAAYYDPLSERYFTYPGGQNAPPGVTDGGTVFGTAVFALDHSRGPAVVMSAGGLSSFGVMALGGNVGEWVETELDGVNDNPSAPRELRGGGWSSPHGYLSSSCRMYSVPTIDGAANTGLGFHVVRRLPQNTNVE